MLFQFCEVGDQGSRRGNGRTEENMREEPKRQCKGDGSGDEGAGGGAGGGGGENWQYKGDVSGSRRGRCGDWGVQ